MNWLTDDKFAGAREKDVAWTEIARHFADGIENAARQGEAARTRYQKDAARHTAVYHPVPPPAAAPTRNAPARSAPARPIVRVDLLPLRPAGRARVLLFPLRPPDGAQRVEQQVREELAAAQQDYQAGNVETARQEFERALQLLVESGFDLRGNPRLAALQQQIVEAERSAETVAANGDSFSAPKTAPAR